MGEIKRNVCSVYSSIGRENWVQSWTIEAGVNSRKASGSCASAAALLRSEPKQRTGQNKHEMAPSTQEISDERKDQQTERAEK